MNERLNTPENHEVHQGRTKHQEAQKTPAEQASSNEKKHDIVEIHRKVETAALSSDEVRSKAEKATHPHRPKEPVSRQTKELVYDRTLLRIRRHLSPLGRATSKIIHQRAVEAVSEAAGKTIARPSGLLGGGLVAFIGSSVYYYMTRHYGYDYHFTVFLLLLGGGFVVGWLAEMFYKGFRPPK